MSVLGGKLSRLSFCIMNCGKDMEVKPPGLTLCERDGRGDGMLIARHPTQFGAWFYSGVTCWQTLEESCFA
jgi:hypothetical protein